MFLLICKRTPRAWNGSGSVRSAGAISRRRGPPGRWCLEGAERAREKANKCHPLFSSEFYCSTLITKGGAGPTGRKPQLVGQDHRRRHLLVGDPPAVLEKNSPSRRASPDGGRAPRSRTRRPSRRWLKGPPGSAARGLARARSRPLIPPAPFSGRPEMGVQDQSHVSWRTGFPSRRRVDEVDRSERSSGTELGRILDQDLYKLPPIHRAGNCGKRLDRRQERGEKVTV